MLVAVTAGATLDEVAIPALLRAARHTYRAAVHRALAEAGFDDVPSNGSFVIGGMARSGAPLGEIVKGLGVSKQATGQLVDMLVARGYLGRSVDPEDRRRLNISLTERGGAAADVIRGAVDGVDRELDTLVGAEAVLTVKRGLGALASLGRLFEAGEHEP
ncbi:MAG TPA: MarR family transcriptional regulator [Acidimicrobiales bacterium]|nr:MarR family transcriptional regulator [Acidimicrobiales bacterium]